MKKLCNILNRCGVRGRLFACLALFGILFFSACNHGNDDVSKKPNNNENSLKQPTLKTLTIKTQDAKLGSVTLKGETVTINQNEVFVEFEQADAPKNFVFSKTFPITLQKGTDQKLKISTAETAKYKAWEKEITLRCTDLETLHIKSITVHTKDATNGEVSLQEELKDVKEGNVEVQFKEGDAPAHRFEGLPITLKAGKNASFKILTAATAKYDKFEATIEVKCEAKSDPLDLTLRKIEVYEKEVKNGEVTIPLKHSSVTKANIKIYFNEDGAPKEVKCEPETLSLVAGEEKTLKVYTEATSKYKKFEKTIKIKREEKKELHLKTLTIHGANATGGSTIIKEESVTKDNVALAFTEDDAPKDFEITPQPFTLEKGATQKLTIKTAETETYKAFEIKVDVKREKDENAPKDIDDVIEALKSQSPWVGAYVDSDIELLTTVTGFAGSSVEWSCDDQEHFTLSGQIFRDIADVELEIKATVTWNGQEKTVTLKTTIKRLEKIEESGQYSDGEKYTKTWDFSEDGVLKRSYNGKATHLWEIKNIDVKKRQFVAQLKKKSFEHNGGELLDLEDYFRATQEEIRKSWSKQFGADYIALKNKDVITWKDLKDYVSKFDLPPKYFDPSKSDEENFNKLKKWFFSNYAGTLSDFNALSDAERTKFVKDELDGIKKRHCRRMGIPENTPDSELVEKLTEKQSQLAKANIEKAKLEYIFSYSTGNNGESFTAKIAYDNNKKWCEQLGRYDNSYTSGERWVGLFPEKANNSIAHIRLGTSKNSVRDNFSGTCQIAQSDSFTLNDDQNSSVTLNCVITDAKDGELTLTTTGAFAGTFKMKFNGNSIEYLL